MKTVLFVPGFQEDIHSRDYSSTIRAIEKCGYEVRFIDIAWDRTTIDNWTATLDSIYQKYDPEDVILAGFSFGAMTAFVKAAKLNPYELWLFSLSPYFKEDIESETMQQAWLKNIGKRRTTAFSKLNFSDLAKNIHSRTLIFAGQKEIDQFVDLKNRTAIANQLILNSQLTIINDVGHDVADSKYVAVIASKISKL